MKKKKSTITDDTKQGQSYGTVAGDNSMKSESTKDSVIILGVDRVLSGALRSKDVEYYCFGPKYNPNRGRGRLAAKSVRLYIFMGSSYVRVNSVPADRFYAIHA